MSTINKQHQTSGNNEAISLSSSEKLATPRVYMIQTTLNRTSNLINNLISEAEDKKTQSSVEDPTHSSSSSSSPSSMFPTKPKLKKISGAKSFDSVSVAKTLKKRIAF